METYIFSAPVHRSIYNHSAAPLSSQAFDNGISIYDIYMNIYIYIYINQFNFNF